MLKSKTRIIVLAIVLLLLLLLPVLYVIFGWVMVLGGMWFSAPNPSEPREVYGEFPFELTYRIGDDLVAVRDVYVCEYDGIGFNEGIGKYRKWKGYIQGTGETAVLVTEDAERKIYCFVGSAEFYMGDEMYPEQRPLAPRLYDVHNSMTFYSQEELLSRYDIELISWTFSDPITNSFE